MQNTFITQCNLSIHPERTVTHPTQVDKTRTQYIRVQNWHTRHSTGRIIVPFTTVYHTTSSPG